MDENKRWCGEKALDQVVSALNKRGMDASWFATADEARSRALEMIPEGASVGVGGSITVRQVGLLSALEERGHTIYQHWQPNLSLEARRQILMSAHSAGVYLASPNAVTLDGRLVSIDMTGNRVTSMAFGPEKVILIAGVNKLVRDVDEGIWRIKNLVAPANAHRMGLKTPCAATGRCGDCDSPDRLCRVVTILERRPTMTPISVLLVNEDLGF